MKSVHIFLHTSRSYIEEIITAWNDRLQIFPFSGAETVPSTVVLDEFFNDAILNKKKKPAKLKTKNILKLMIFSLWLKCPDILFMTWKYFKATHYILCICRCNHFLSSNPIFISARYLWLFWIQILKWIKIFPILLKLSLQVQNPFKALLNTLASYEPHLLKTTQDIQISCVIFRNLK